MKQTLLSSVALVLALAGGCDRPLGLARGSAARPPNPPTFSSFDEPGATNMMQGHTMRMVDADLEQVLALYQEFSRRSLIRSPSVSPNIKITFQNTTAMTRAEALQALDNVLAAQNITMVYLGTRYVKVVPSAQAPQETGPVVELPWQELPDSSSYLTYITKLKYIAPEQATGILQPFAKLPNSIIAMKGSDIIVLRDYSSNVRRMMEILETVDKSGTNVWPFAIPRRK